jgi:hypothetical protein
VQGRPEPTYPVIPLSRGRAGKTSKRASTKPVDEPKTEPAEA